MNTPWKLGLGAVAFVLIAAGLVKSCGFTEPLVIPDWADSLRAAHVQYSADSAHIATDLYTERVKSDSLSRVAETWRQRASIRPARPPRLGTIPPHSGTDTALVNTGVRPDSSGFTGDSAAYIGHLRAVNDSLWTALDASDSAYSNLVLAYSEQRQATAAAMAGWAAADTALVRERLIADRAIKSLTSEISRARRGCRVLGLLPCVQPHIGFGASLVGGKVVLAPQIGLSIPLRLRV
jgi:hypothetical protein